MEITYVNYVCNLKIETDSPLCKKILELVSKENKKKLTIKINSNKSIETFTNSQLVNATIIKIGDNVNMQIDLSKFKKSKEIYFGNSFNSEFILSDSIQKIIFKRDSVFNKQNKMYPEYLLHLEFGYCFNQPLDNLPNRLKYLLLGYQFNQQLEFLPESLLFLEFEGSTVFNNQLDNLPNNISTLRIKNLDTNINKFPTNIKILHLGDAKNLSNIINIKNYNCIEEIVIDDTLPKPEAIIDIISGFHDYMSNLKKIICKDNYGHMMMNDAHKISNMYNLKVVNDKYFLERIK
jgi:hypothetical protein